MYLGRLKECSKRYRCKSEEHRNDFIINNEFETNVLDSRQQKVSHKEIEFCKDVQHNLIQPLKEGDRWQKCCACM